MVPLTAGVVIVGLALALLVARGVYLIGQGNEAEMRAREKAGDSGVIDSGWFVLDWARDADLSTLEWLEDKLGINQDDN